MQVLFVFFALQGLCAPLSLLIFIPVYAMFICTVFHIFQYIEKDSFMTISRIKDYLAAHKRARIAAYALLALLLFIIVFHPKGTKTFLILGMDNYGSIAENSRSDVMMLVQVDFTRSKISTVTFARDMFIPNEDGHQQKINSIVRTSDENALVTALENAFGLDIDGWFRVNFTTVIQLLDAIGGARVELTSKEASYIERTVGDYPDSPLSEGLCRLNGAQALAFARCRALDNDMGRGQRQSRLMAAMVAQTRRMTALNVVNVFAALKHAWSSSLSGFAQVRLLGSALWLRGAKVTSIGVPFEGHWHYGEVKGNNGVVINMDQNVRLLREALGLKPLVLPAQ